MNRPQDTASAPRSAAPTGASFFSRAVLYPNLYVWCLFLASLDIMLTWIVLHFGGYELNRMIDHVLSNWGLPGMTIFKSALIFFVICLCEVVGRRNDRTGRRLAEWAVAINAIPVTFSLILLLDAVYLQAGAPTSPVAP